ncbi:hypothetical protein MXD61_06915 [Frankia sp. AgPm24]|uniref:hypothetical protein n=1 Tax=Frankia sp. AgPm24 TaxID=631128 RepID=UPI0020106776|nr:hypothetical protein [Frankia sp. AgPm24]MCK9921622.1 hypothetical protein [Frankia sp. AgPm24]
MTDGAALEAAMLRSLEASLGAGWITRTPGIDAIVSLVHPDGLSILVSIYEWDGPWIHASIAHRDRAPTTTETTALYVALGDLRPSRVALTEAGHDLHLVGRIGT